MHVSAGLKAAHPRAVKHAFCIPSTSPRAAPPQALAFVERRKAGLLAGWTWGTALLIRRLPGGAWSAPLFLRLRCGSLGLTLGGQRLRAVYVLQASRRYRVYVQLCVQLCNPARPTSAATLPAQHPSCWPQLRAANPHALLRRRRSM